MFNVACCSSGSELEFGRCIYYDIDLSFTPGATPDTSDEELFPKEFHAECYRKRRAFRRAQEGSEASKSQSDDSEPLEGGL